jgi:hypothetical protein
LWELPVVWLQIGTIDPTAAARHFDTSDGRHTSLGYVMPNECEVHTQQPPAGH